jgi:hypothetical protein
MALSFSYAKTTRGNVEVKLLAIDKSIVGGQSRMPMRSRAAVNQSNTADLIETRLCHGE